MWYIMSASGLRGIERYSSKSEAEWAAELRNSLINQGWHPVRVAQAILFFGCAPAVVARSFPHNKPVTKN